MSITDIRPWDIPIDLRLKIEKIMTQENVDWKGAILFLARKVVSPK